MAFLGLTYLGPQDSFRVNMKKSGLLAAFKDDEFASAFDAVAGDARTLDAVLQLVYRGPPLECDRDRVRAHLDDDAPLTKDALLGRCGTRGRTSGGGRRSSEIRWATARSSSWSSSTASTSRGTSA